MAIYESQGFGSLLYEYKGNLTPFDYIAQFKPMKPPEDMTIDAFKKTKAPYCISGKVKAEKNGTIKRNNESLLYRDLVFLDYDNIPEKTLLIGLIEVRRLTTKGACQPHPVRFPTFPLYCTFLFTLGFRNLAIEIFIETNCLEL